MTQDGHWMVKYHECKHLWQGFDRYRIPKKIAKGMQYDQERIVIFVG